MTIVALAASGSLSRQGVSAGPVVAMLAVITLIAVVSVLATAYVMHRKDRR